MAPATRRSDGTPSSDLKRSRLQRYAPPHADEGQGCQRARGQRERSKRECGPGACLRTCGQAWITVLSRMISALFCRDGDVAFVAKELRDVLDPQGGAWLDGRHIKETGFLAGPTAPIGSIPAGAEVEAVASPAALTVGGLCGTCREYAVVHEVGCEGCKSCGASKCS